MFFNLEAHDEWIEKYFKNIGSCGSAAIPMSEVVKKGKYVNPKLKMYGEKVAVNYRDGGDVPDDKHCESTGVLRIASIYNQ